MKCLRSVEGILNFTMSNSSEDFATLSSSLSPCIPIWLGTQQMLTILPYNIIIIVQYIQDIWMINNHTMKRL